MINCISANCILEFQSVIKGNVGNIGLFAILMLCFYCLTYFVVILRLQPAVLQAPIHILQIRFYRVTPSRLSATQTIQDSKASFFFFAIYPLLLYGVKN